MEQGELLRYTIEVLDRLAVPYMLVGSIASGVYGEMRMTHDIDLVVDLASEKVNELCAAFSSPQFYVSATAAAEAVRRGSQFNVIEPPTGQKIDFMISPRSNWGRSQLARRREEWIFFDVRGFVAAPEDIILSKLIYYREGDSEKHPRDIAAMLRVSPDQVDYSYIESWLGELGVAEQWQKVLARIGPQK